jgi:hypothetical protein
MRAHDVSRLKVLWIIERGRRIYKAIIGGGVKRKSRQDLHPAGFI